MSVSIGVYEFFAYTIPGYFYLAVAGVVLFILDIVHPFELLADLNGLHFIMLSVGAYGLGLLLDPLAKWAWQDPFKKKKAKEQAWLNVSKRNDTLQYNMDPHQWPLLQAHARLEDTQASMHYERFQATSIMLRNLSFSFVLICLTIILSLFAGYLSLMHILTAGFCLLAAILSIRQSQKFSVWAYETVFDTFVASVVDLKDLVTKKP